MSGDNSGSEGRDGPERPRHLLHLEASQEMLAHAGEEVVNRANRMW
jgi:large conductance mechanosensitive channel